jgi:putative FmdB family regulatory protein
MALYKYFCKKCHKYFEKSVAKALTPPHTERCPDCGEDSALVSHAFREEK